MNIFTNEQLQELLTSQRTLNEKYTGEKWMDIVPLEKFLIAVQTEVSEFYESAPRLDDWKWWKKQKNDPQNMVIESIDVVHFGLSALMYNASDDAIIDLNTNFAINSISVDGSARSILTSMTSFVDYSFDGSPSKQLLSFYKLINNMAIASERDLNEIYNGYFKKNELNHKRVEGGYQEGNYAKINADGVEDNAALKV